MSEDNVTAQEAPESSALEQTSGQEASVPAQAGSEAEVKQPEVSVPEEEKITFSKQEFDNQAAKIKAIAERKTRREYEGKYQADLEKMKTQQSPQQPSASNYQPQAQPQQPSPDHVWDDVLGYIHKDTSREQYSGLIAQALMAQTSTGQQPQAQTTVQQPVQQPTANYNDLSPRAWEQLDECLVEYDDFKATAGKIITKEMANAAALAPNGMKLLYELNKENPLEVYKIAQLSPDEQKFKVFELQQKAAEKAKLKVGTKATPQPAPLDSNGNVKTKYEDLSFAERKALDLKKQWGD